MTAVRPFLIALPQHDLDDLTDRLRRTRWPDRETVADRSQGVPLDYLRDLCAHWADGYDWRATERQLNLLPQFTTTIDGVDIHLVNLRSAHPDAIPLVLTHGWPGSFLEFEQVMAPLADGERSACTGTPARRPRRRGCIGRASSRSPRGSRRPLTTLKTLSPSPPRAPSSRRRYRDRRAVGRPGDLSTFVTGENRFAVGTSAPGNSPRCSSRRSGPGSALLPSGRPGLISAG